MARIRTIKPEFFRSEDVGVLTPMARLLFIGLWTIADREGRLLDRPRRISADVFPYDEDFDVASLLQELESAGLIDRYEVDGQKCIQIENFSKHQRPHPKEPPSEIPAAAAKSLRKQRQISGDVGQSRVLQLPAVERNVETTPSRLGMEKGREGNGGSLELSASPPSKPNDPPVLVFPCAGEPAAWNLTATQVALWRTLYPAADVESECRKALAWVLAHASRKKTSGGMLRFLTGWLGKAQDRGPSPPRGSPSRSPPSHADPDQLASRAAWREKTA